MHKSFKQIVDEVAVLHTERSKIYEEAYKFHGGIMARLFPDGITLKSPEDFTRFSLLNIVVGKLHRYSKSFTKGGHNDSIRDAGVYCLMLEEVDGIVAAINEAKRERANESRRNQ